jgi:quinol-cytochrome oxidoreductase complex cytochrome b subunit
MWKPLALVVAGILFLLYPAFRPWADETTVQGAISSMSSTAWVVSHFFAMIGFILVPLGLLALRTKGPALLFAIGSGLVLPYYGAEDFGLHAIARNGNNVLEQVDAVRYQPLAMTIFGLGLVAIAVAAVWAAMAVWRDSELPRYSGIAFGLGFALFLPQFFTPAPVRIGHGVLVAVGCVWLAAALWRRAGRV